MIYFILLNIMKHFFVLLVFTLDEEYRVRHRTCAWKYLVQFCVPVVRFVSTNVHIAHVSLSDNSAVLSLIYISI